MRRKTWQKECRLSLWVPTAPAAAPPAAPPQTNSSVFETPSSGVKREYIRVDGTLSPQAAYMRKFPGRDGAVWPTVEAKDRMLVEIVTGTPPYGIKLLNTSQGTWLALKWKKPNVSIAKGVVKAAAIVTLNDFGAFHCNYELPKWVGPHRGDIWSVSMDGTIQAWWEDGVTSLVEALYHRTDHIVGFVADPNTYIDRYPEWMRARLVFEPVA
ncbi:hypothetical protein M407DRAFT_33595 [Tulasnella calospora MUT 4182]|uniref:Uncharacterized protein n=1 Tax=Tulasnella calospora MUT 4182 TaxID=1051891 RepID=A0A0C3K5U0_9AGAM|nr:hypothetical protein M407DRAFT_33595 [Tulasnella calospora MUT 4182]